jgi:hypothetical protein
MNNTPMIIKIIAAKILMVFCGNLLDMILPKNIASTERKKSARSVPRRTRYGLY